MQVVYVHKDIGEYEEKVLGKLSARVVVCIAGGLGTSVLAAAFAHLALGVAVADASLPVMACSMPFWLAAFWRPKGLKPEEFLPLAIRHRLEDGRLVYEPGFLAAEDAWPQQEEKKKPSGQRRLARAWRKGGELYEPTREQQG